ncbi:MAG TPA: 5-(carboxyamino)imidazole ribonucleotide synthase [Myxococcales bacterium LLY-WYZ-16_1]|nr:5-(carboxyamino)imidazole ribonucleotide synthase [Myxococcales bacterium LLY-WYZ-16_1]
MNVLFPGQVIGILGSGQLGRMLAYEARRLGYGVRVYSPERNTPTGAVSDVETVGDWDDRERVEAFASGCDVITYEFENVPTETADLCAKHCPVHPGPHVLQVAQDRLREKQAAARLGCSVADFRSVESSADLEAAIRDLGAGVLKTARSGYDGKGQQSVEPSDDPSRVWQRTGGVRCVYERRVPFDAEVSVVVARSALGRTVTYPVIRNVHRNRVLDVSVCPAGLGPKVEEAARRTAVGMAEGLDVVGVVCVEMFVVGEEVLMNEVAPRPHNSGHWSLDAADVSQFEMQLRAVCGLPLVEPQLRAPCAMANLLGEIWLESGPNGPRWDAVLSRPRTRLHLYGKTDPRPLRKMGHVTVWAEDTAEAERQVLDARTSLLGSP